MTVSRLRDVPGIGVDRVRVAGGRRVFGERTRALLVYANEPYEPLTGLGAALA